MTGLLQPSFYVEHKTLMSQQSLDNFSRTMSRHYQIMTTMSRHNFLVMTRAASHDKSWGTKMTTMSRHNFLCRDKATNWARIFEDPQFQP